MSALVCTSGISIHAPHTGRDINLQIGIDNPKHFNPRAPYGARPSQAPMRHTPELFQSTRPIRGATLTVQPRYWASSYFNPRAPYGARPSLPPVPAYPTPHFNPRAPYGARRGSFRRLWRKPCYFNPRAPYGARPSFPSSAMSQSAISISIHAPHTGRDDDRYTYREAIKLFQSTRPIRGATLCVQ